jgi:hypothetical protein
MAQALSGVQHAFRRPDAQEHRVRERPDSARYRSIWSRLRVRYLCWELVWAWTPWLCVQALRGLWVVWSLSLKQRPWWMVLSLTAVWVVGKVVDEFTKPVKEPIPPSQDR